jgi:hypothetical protein
LGLEHLDFGGLYMMFTQKQDVDAVAQMTLTSSVCPLTWAPLRAGYPTSLSRRFRCPCPCTRSGSDDTGRIHPPHASHFTNSNKIVMPRFPSPHLVIRVNEQHIFR